MTITQEPAPRLAREHSDPAAGFSAMDAALDVEAQTLAAWVDMNTRQPGDVDAARARHAWRVGDPTQAYDQTATGTAPAPDWYTRVKSSVKVGRSKRGPSRKVTRHGRALVIGDTSVTRGHATERANVLASVILRGAVRDDGRADGATIARITSIAYRDLIPPLLGVDTVSWEDVASPVEPDKVRVMANRHADLAGRPGGTLAMPAGARGFLPRAATRPAKHAVRLSLPKGRQRDSDPRERTTVRTRCVGPCGPRPDDVVHTVHHLRAPHADTCADNGRNQCLFIGHALYTRGATKRAQRAARTRRVDERVTVPDDATLGEALASITAYAPRGYRVAWTWRSMTGALVVADDGAISVSGSGIRVRGVKRGATLARRITAQLAQA